MSMDDPPQGEYNPYASPRVELRFEAERLDFLGQPLRFDVGEILSRTWAIYQARMGLVIGLVMTWLVLSVVGLLVFGVIQENLEKATWNINLGFGLISLVFSLGMLALIGSLYLGQTIVMLRIARNEDGASIGGLFSGGPAVIRWLLAMFLIGVISLPIGLVYVVPVLFAAGVSRGDMTTIILVATPALFLSWLLAMVLTIRLTPTVFLIVEGAGPIEVIVHSMRLTKGRFWPLVLIYLLVMVINMVGSLALLVGLIFTIPFTMLMLAVTYAAMVGEPASSPISRTPLDRHDGLI